METLTFMQIPEYFFDPLWLLPFQQGHIIPEVLEELIG